MLPRYSFFLSLILVCAYNQAARAETSLAPPSSAINTPTVPPSNNSSEAYKFRANLGVDPICKEIGRKSDAAFFNNLISAEQKIALLEQLHAQAKAASCLPSSIP